MSSIVKEDIPFFRDIKNENTRWLWHADFYDYPRSGLMLYNGEKTWFSEFEEEIIEEDEESCAYSFTQTSYYHVYRVKPESLVILEHNHELFCKYVGTHTDYDINSHRNVGAVLPDWQQGYKELESKRIPLHDKLVDGEIIASFKY